VVLAVVGLLAVAVGALLALFDGDKIEAGNQPHCAGAESSARW